MPMTLLTFLVVVAALGDVREATGRESAGRPAPTPIPTTYRFVNDVVVEARQDTNRDGRPDTWSFFEGKRLVRFEADRDYDGRADWRETWTAAPPWCPDPTIQFLGGRWRIVPGSLAYQPDTANYTGRAEKWVDGRWVDTFVDRLELSRVEPDGGDRPQTSTSTETWSYKDGKPVEFRGPGQLKRWEAGRLAFWELRSGNRWSVTNYSPNGDSETLERTQSGVPVARWSVKAGVPQREQWRDGQWMEVRVTELKDAQGRVYDRVAYKGGMMVSHEQVEPRSGIVTRRQRYAAYGSWVDEQMTSDGAPYLRTFVGPKWSWTRAERFVAGAWTADFVDDDAHSRATYRGGRLTRVEFKPPTGDDTTRVRSFPDPDHEEWGDGRVTRRWLTYAPLEPGRVRRLVREARDLDGDGIADLDVDYDRLTIRQP
jgi:hypothetical protein